MLRAGVMVIALLLPSEGFAAGVALGKICLEGVQAEIKNDESTRDAKGVWADAAYSSQPQSPGRFVLFRRPIQSYKEFPTCGRITELEAKRQNQPILAGTISDLQIKAHLFTAVSGSNRIQIDENEFHATLTAVTSNRRPAHGGTLDLRGSPTLSLVNTKRILTDSTSGVGNIEITASGLLITNARVALRGGATVTATLSPAAPTDQQVFAIDIADGQILLLEGTLSGVPTSHLKGAVLDFGAVSLADADLLVKRVEIAATRLTTAVTLTSLSGQSASLLAGGSALKYLATSPKLVALRVTGAGARNAEAIAIGAPVIEALKVTAGSAQAVAATGGTILAGAAILEIAKASKDAIDATSTWTKPSVPAAEFFLPPSTVTTARWNLSGALNALSVSGEFNSTVQRLETLTARHPVAIRLVRTGVSNVIRIPIKTDVNNISGSFAIANQDQSGVLTATLKRFHLDGFLIVDLADLKNTRAEFPVDGIQVRLEATAATQPFVAGTKPAFAAVGVTGRNRTPLTVGATRSGQFDLAADTVTLGEPVLRVGKDGSEARASLTLNSKGTVLITSDIQTGGLLLTRGTFEAKGTDGANGIEFHLLEKGKWVDLGGTRVVDPVLTVKTLSVHVDTTQTASVGFGKISGVSVSASSITKPADPAHPTEVSYSGTLAEPFTIDEFAAAHVEIKDVLVIDLVTISKFALHITGADVRLGGDARITNGELRLGGVNLQEVKVNDTTVRNFQQVRIVVSGNIDPGSALGVNNQPSFRVDLVASGQSDQLSGDGSAHLGAFSGFKETELDTGFPCVSGATLKAPFEFNFAIGETDLSAHLRDGRFSGQAQIGPIALLAHTKSRSDCDGKSEHYIVVAGHKAWTEWLCTKCENFSCTVYSCRLEVDVPEVSFNWHPHAQVEFAAVALAMTAPVVRFSEGAMHLCNVGAVVIPATLAVMGVSPNIETPYPGASDLVNNLLNAAFVGAQSLALTNLSQGVGWTLSGAATGIGNLMCIK